MTSFENQNFSTETTPEPEVTFNESGSAIHGLMNKVKEWRINRLSKQMEQLVDDKGFYEHVAVASLKMNEPNPAYEPLASFSSVHMSTRADYGERVPKVNITPQARTQLQGNAAIRARLRQNAIHNKAHTIDQYDSLYPQLELKEKSSSVMSRDGSGFFIPWGDRRLLKKQLSDDLEIVSPDKGVRKGVQGAGKEILKSQRRVRRLETRLLHSQSGKDIPGRIVHRKHMRKAVKIDKLSGNL